MYLQNSNNFNRTSGMIAPLSGNSLGLQRAQVTHGIRQVIIILNIFSTFLHVFYLSLLHRLFFAKIKTTRLDYV